MATDEIVSLPFSYGYQGIGVFIKFPGDGTFQDSEMNAKVIVPGSGSY